MNSQSRTFALSEIMHSGFLYAFLDFFYELANLALCA